MADKEVGVTWDVAAHSTLAVLLDSIFDDRVPEFVPSLEFEVARGARARHSSELRDRLRGSTSWSDTRRPDCASEPAGPARDEGGLGL